MIGKSKKKILILGSRGQIGSSLEVYLKKKYNVEGVDILNGKNEDLRSNSNKIQSLIKNTDFVFFLASFPVPVLTAIFFKTFSEAFLANSCHS